MSILYIEPILKCPIPHVVAILLCLGIIIGGVISYIFDSHDCDIGFGISLFIGLSLIVVASGVGSLYKKPTELNKYKVTFNKDYKVDINEFLNKYKVIDKEGDLYILEDREVKED